MNCDNFTPIASKSLCRRSAIGSKLVGLILVFSSIITLFIFSFELCIEYLRGIQGIRSRFVEIQSSYAESAAAGLWAMDRHQLERMAQGIVTLPMIQRVDIREHAPPGMDPLVVSAGSHQSTTTEEVEFPLFVQQDGRPFLIGAFHIEATLDTLYTDLGRHALFILGTQALKTLLVVSFILLIVRRLITRRLLALESTLNASPLDGSNGGPRWPLDHTRDEIDRLAATLSFFREKLVANTGELRMAKQQMESILDNIPDLAWVKGRDGRFLAANRRLSETFGLSSPTEILGKTDFDLSPPEIAAGYRAADLRVLATGQPERIEEEHIHAQGQTFAIETLKTPIRDEHGTVVGVAGIARDITTRKEIENALRAANSKLDTLIRNLPGNIYRFRYDANNRRDVVFFDGALERRISGKDHTGFVSLEELHERYHPDDAAFIHDTLPKRLRETDDVLHIVRRLLPDGSCLWLRSREHVVERHGDDFITEGISIDVTAEIQAREAQQHSESMFRNLVSLTAVGVVGCGADGRCHFINDQMLEKTGLERDEVIGGDWFQAVHPADQERVNSAWTTANQQKNAFREEHRIVRRTDAKIIWMMVQGAPQVDGDGRVVGWIVVAVDISERKTHELTQARVNRVLRTLGAGNEVLLRANDEALLHAAMCQTIVQSGSYRMAFVGLLMDNEEAKVQVAAHAGVEDGYLAAAALTSRDDDCRGGGPTGTAIRTGTLQVNRDTATNPAMVPWREAALQRGYRSSLALPLGLDGRVFGCLNIYADETDAFSDEEMTLLSELANSFAYAIAALRERRLREELERRMMETQKLEALGQLAGGIAHDFNNLLGAIHGFSRFIAEDSKENDPSHRHANQIIAACERGKSLINQILSFSHKNDVEIGVVSVRQLLSETSILMMALIPKSLCSITVPDVDAFVLGNQERIEQAIINLCINAQHAMQGRSGGIVVSMEIRPALTVGEADRLTAPPPSVWTDEDGIAHARLGTIDHRTETVVIRVRDNGCGMDPVVLTHAFTPFFTTKPKGRGTGLGLSMVQDMARSFGAGIRVDSQIGVGTTVDLLFPAQPAHPHQPSATLLPLLAPHQTDGDGVRILLVEDDASFGNMLLLALERCGFEASPCSDPRDVLLELDENTMVWHAIIVDQRMPHISGLDLIRALRARGVSIPCVLCSGYTEETITESVLNEAGVSFFFRKPINIDCLIQRIIQLVR